MKLTKLLVGSAIALPATIVPLSTITSCAQSWGHLSAFSIGGATPSSGPYAELDDALLDHDGVAYSSYLQSNYALDQASNVPYAYSSPMKWNGDQEVRKWVQGESGWYGYGNSAFNAYASYKDDEGKTVEVPNAQNAALSSNISFVSTIGTTINNFISNSLRYQASFVDVNDDADTKIRAAWGSQGKTPFTIDYGTKGAGNEYIHNFFEYNFASANLNGSGRAEAMLRPVNLIFQFEKFPLPSYNFNGEILVGLDNTTFLSTLEGGDVLPPYYDKLTHYTNKGEPVDDGDGEEHTTYTYNCVPILITVDSLTQSYLNPKLSGSFLVNDYYSNDDQVKNTIGNQWKVNLNEKTGCGQDNAIPRYKTFKWTTGSQAFEPATEEIDSRLPMTIYGRQFIALIDYSLTVHKIDQSKDVASINGLRNLFPACWLDIFPEKDWFVKANDDFETQYIFNETVINDLSRKFNKIVSGGQNKLPTDAEGLSLLTFLGYMFGTDNKVSLTEGNETLSLLDDISYPD